MFKKLKHKIISGIYRWSEKRLWKMNSKKREEESKNAKAFNWDDVRKVRGIDSKEIHCLSGCNVKVYFNEKEVKDIQGFSYKRTTEGLKGTAVFVVFEEMHEYYDKEVQMTAKATVNKKLVTVFDEKIKFNEERFGIAVDDIVCDQTFDFIGL